MTTDRELLELCAKAFWGEEFEDVSIRWSEADDGILYIHAENQDHNGLDREFVWAPHRDQADSDCMACDLEIGLEFKGKAVVARSRHHVMGQVALHDGTKESKYAAVRRARVLVVAEIGRAMK